MAGKTLIRNERPHEVSLGQDSQVAQSHKTDASEVLAVPSSVRTSEVASGARSTKRPDEKGMGSPSDAPASRRKTRAPSTAESSPAAARKRTGAAAGAQAAVRAAPKLPARVPADRLWEDDSAVMQRLNALLQHNARLAEQLQRLQSPAHPKGFKP